MNEKTLKGWYDYLVKDRGEYVERARMASRLTVPSLFPEAGQTGANALASRYQSLGAQLVNGLANKMVLALFPPGSPFFRLSLDARAKTKIEALKATADPAEVEKAKAEIEAALADQELLIQQAFETVVNRGDLAQACRYLLVGGPAAFYVEESGRTRLLRLEQLGLQRSGGMFSKIVTESFKHLSEIPEGLREKAKAAQAASTTDTTQRQMPDKDRDEVAVYTGQFLMPDGRYEVWQELSDGTALEERAYFAKEFAPIIVAGFAQLPSEDYPRSMVEDHLGDLNALEALTRSSIVTAAAAARTLGLVDPASAADPKELTEAPNGSFVTGRKDDVTMLQTNKNADLAAVTQVMEPIASRLRSAFLSTTAAQRAGERVTAEEIRLVAQELESSLGGVYSTLAATLQYPLLIRLVRSLEKSKQLSPLGDSVRPTIITGLEALGRQAEAARLTQFLTAASTTLGPEGVLRNLKPRGVLRVLASAFGVSTANSAMFKTEQEVAQEEAAARQAALAQPALEAAAKSAAGAGAKAYVERAAAPPGETA